MCLIETKHGRATEDGFPGGRAGASYMKEQLTLPHVFRDINLEGLVGQRVDSEVYA